MITKETTPLLIIGTLSGILLSSLMISSIEKLKSKSKEKLKSSNKTKKPQPVLLPPEFREEQLSRTSLYFSSSSSTSSPVLGENFEKIKSSHVLIITGSNDKHTSKNSSSNTLSNIISSHASIMLARNGVKRIHLLEVSNKDSLTKSPLKHDIQLQDLLGHAVATLDDVGSSHIETMKHFIHEICCDNNEYCEVTSSSILHDHDLLQVISNQTPSWDYVIDATTSIVKFKSRLMEACVEKKIKLVSVMNIHDNLLDPTRTHISDLDSTAGCDVIAAAVRYDLKKRNVYQISDFVKVIHSNEKQASSCISSNIAHIKTRNQQTSIHNTVLSSIFGLACAGLALCDIGNKPFQPQPVEKKLGRHVKHRMLQHLRNRENLKASEINFDMNDVEFILTFWGFQCVITNNFKIDAADIELYVWNKESPCTIFNVIPIGREVADKHFHDIDAILGSDRRNYIENELNSLRIVMTK